MPAIPNSFRRGAVYHWRKRVPASLCNHLKCSWIVLSLGTKDQPKARVLAARLDAESTTLFELAMSNIQITAQQTKEMFRAALTRHLSILDRVAASERNRPGFDYDASVKSDRHAGAVYKLMASRGPDVRIDDTVVVELKTQGFDERDIFAISNILDALKFQGTRDSVGRLEALLGEVSAPVTEVNLGIAQQIKHRAIAAACFAVERRWGFNFEDDATLLNALCDLDARDVGGLSRSPASVQMASPPVEPRTPAPPSPPPATPEDNSDQSPVSSPEECAAIADIMAVAESLNKQRVGGNSWSQKTSSQFLQTAKLFVRFLREEYNVLALSALKQQHLTSFYKFLRDEIYVHYGKSEHDAGKTIAELRAQAIAKEQQKAGEPAQIHDVGKARAKPERVRGLSTGTLDRHLVFLSQLFEHAPSESIKVDPNLTFKGLRSAGPKKDRARNARPAIQPSQSQSVFEQFPYTGCKSWDRPGVYEKGSHVYHRALFFAPMLAHYGGERREEICGALVSDVIVGNGPIPYLHLAPNEYRGLKNSQSQRNMPIHPEPVRLGFLEYVAEIKALGYKLLFPDLYSPTTKSPLGDRLQDEFKPVLIAAGITEKGAGMHSKRHGFGNNLKQKGATVEERADALGHGGKDETSERYCDPYEIETMYDIIKKLPIVTGHLQPSPIQLVPWVAAKQTAPFSKPGRTKEAKARNILMRKTEGDPEPRRNSTKKL
jgi:integrase